MDFTQQTILILLAIVNTAFTYKADKFAKNVSVNTKPLFDFGHYLLPNTSQFRILNDIVPAVLLIVAYTSRSSELSKLTKALVFAVLMRIVTVYSTILPSSTRSCKFAGIIGGCHDKIFSGHTTVAILCSFFLSKTYPKYTNHLILLNFLLLMSIISSRDHYTIDVLIALIISVLISVIMFKQFTNVCS
jgi:hypothetical protein